MSYTDYQLIMCMFNSILYKGMPFVFNGTNKYLQIGDFSSSITWKKTYMHRFCNTNFIFEGCGIAGYKATNGYRSVLTSVKERKVPHK